MPSFLSKQIEGLGACVFVSVYSCDGLLMCGQRLKEVQREQAGGDPVLGHNVL